jgi:hypothetical protein
VFEKWESAQVKVIARERITGAGSNADGTIAARYKFIVEVDPPDGQPFRAEVKESAWIARPGYTEPSVGETILAKVDFKRQKVKLDVQDPSHYQDTSAAKRSQKQAFDDLLKGGGEPEGHEPGPALDVSPEEQLRKLTYIHEHGVISDEQFEEDKAKIVGL